MRRQVVEQFDLLIHAERRPRLDHRVEAARRIHQQRRPRADHFIARRHAIDDHGRHDSGAIRPYQAPRIRRRQPTWMFIAISACDGAADNWCCRIGAECHRC